MLGPAEYVETQRSSQILERSRQSRAYLAHYLSFSGRTPLEKLTLNLLQQQSPDGSWGSNDYPLWTDVLTGIAIQTLLSSGFTEDATWNVTPREGGGLPYVGGIRFAVDFLCREKPDPGWGEDCYDTCQVLIALSMLRDRSRASHALDLGFDYLLSELETDFADQREGDWFGPGIYAATLDALSIRGTNRAECVEIIERLASMQNDVDGYFGTPDLTPDFKVFHTSMCVSSLSAQGLPTATASVERALSWLERTQDASGGWGTALSKIKAIFTSFAIIALSAFRGSTNTFVERGSDWLLAHQSEETGGIEGIEGTVMGLRALSRTQEPSTSQILPITHLVEINRILVEAEAMISTMANAIQRSEEELEDLRNFQRAEAESYLIRITHKRAAQVGLWVGILGIVLALAAFVPLVH